MNDAAWPTGTAADFKIGVPFEPFEPDPVLRSVEAPISRPAPATPAITTRLAAAAAAAVTPPITTVRRSTSSRGRPLESDGRSPSRYGHPFGAQRRFVMAMHLGSRKNPHTRCTSANG